MSNILISRILSLKNLIRNLMNKRIYNILLIATSTILLCWKITARWMNKFQ